MAGYEERPGTDEYREFYAGYVARVPPGDIVERLRTQLDGTLELVTGLPPAGADYAYAPGKWSVKQVIGHLADSERIMSMRAVCFARGEAAPLPPFEEDAYVAAAGFERRTLASLVAELGAVRAATVALFDGLPPDAWTRWGTASGHPITVRALAWIIAGHELHHRAILEERYLPALAR